MRGLNRRHLTFNVARVKSKPKLPDFEQSLAELEALVTKLEQGDVPLEEALKTFERGVGRTRPSQTPRRTPQPKVVVLLARNGEESVEPFEDEDDDDDAAGR